MGQIMNCFDCATESRDVMAVAVCRDCGMALCVKHARVAPRAVRHHAGVGVASAPGTGRRAVCGVCDAAARP